MLCKDPVFRIMGDRALLVELGDAIAPEINLRVQELFQTLDARPLEGVVDLVPCYRSVMIVYDPLKLKLDRLKTWVLAIGQGEKPEVLAVQRTLNVPVIYGGEYGPDLEWVARHLGMTPADVVRWHSARTYRVYMLGFTPGHPYLGELPDELAAPRKAMPRPAVPSGSVGIAQKQIVVYPGPSPGGFQIIGRTPLVLFDPAKKPPTLFRMGDLVKFCPVTSEEVKYWV